MELKDYVLFGLLVLLTCLISVIALSSGYSVVEFPSNTSVDVYIQDQHTEIIDLKLARYVDDIELLYDYEIGDRVIVIETTGSVPTVGDTLCFKEDTAFYQGRPTSVTLIAGNQYTIELDTPLDYPFTTAGGCSLTNTNLAVDGSVTPVIFSVTPKGLNNVSWDITRFMLLFGGEGIGPTKESPDDSDFGVMSAISNGIVLRSVDGVTKNIFNAKTNGDLRSRAYDLTYIDKAKNGQYTVALRRTFAGANKNGVTVRLNSITGDTFELIVQDDLTDMTGGQAIVQGHVVD